jgi:hypothetical protein
VKIIMASVSAAMILIRCLADSSIGAATAGCAERWLFLSQAQSLITNNYRNQASEQDGSGERERGAEVVTMHEQPGTDGPRDASDVDDQVTSDLRSIEPWIVTLV